MNTNGIAFSMRQRHKSLKRVLALREQYNKPIYPMKHILNCLAFYIKHGGLLSFRKTERHTVRAIRSLEKRGFLRVNWQTHQAEYTGKC